MVQKTEPINGKAELLEHSKEFQDVVSVAIARLGIWIDPAIYRVRSHLVPFAVRDAYSRSKASKDGSESWGAPDARGFFRDDNTLIKNWVKSLTISSPQPLYNGRRIGNGFVACHVWRGSVNDKPLHADPLLNSFVPNLVWLPSDLARLSDRVGSYTQRLLQVMARRIYGNVTFKGPIRDYVDQSWQRLPPPENPPVVSTKTVSYFSHEPLAIRRQDESLIDVIRGIQTVRDGGRIAKVYSKRYGPGLRALPTETIDALLAFLSPFVEPRDLFVPQEPRRGLPRGPRHSRFRRSRRSI